MEKVQPNNPAAHRAPATVDNAKRESSEEVGRSKNARTQALQTQAQNGKPLPVDASQRLEAAAAKDRAQVEEAANKVNEYAKQQAREVRFTVDQELGRPVVKVVDSSRDVVVRQIPSEVVIRLARNLEEYMEYSEYSGATEPDDSDQSPGSAETSGAANGIEPGQLINTNV